MDCKCIAHFCQLEGMFVDFIVSSPDTEYFWSRHSKKRGSGRSEQEEHIACVMQMEDCGLESPTRSSFSISRLVSSRS